MPRKYRLTRYNTKVLETERQMQALSFSSLAAKTNLSIHTVQNVLLNGGGRPSSVEKLAIALRVPMDRLLQGELAEAS